MDIIFIFFYAVLTIYILKTVVRVILSAVYHLKRAGDEMGYPMFSVIVPAYNEEVVIEKCARAWSSPLYYSSYFSHQ